VRGDQVAFCSLYSAEARVQNPARAKLYIKYLLRAHHCT